MIIANNSKYIKSDRDTLEGLTDQFKLFKKHNFNVIRSIESNFSKNRKQSMYRDPYSLFKKFENTGNGFKLTNLYSNIKFLYAAKFIKKIKWFSTHNSNYLSNEDKKINSKYLSDFFTPTKQSKIKKCNSWAEFAKFIDGNKEVKQTKSNACGSHLLCPFCASRKASKVQKRIEDFFFSFDDSLKLFDSSINYDDSVSSIINNEYDKKVSPETLKAVEKVKNQYGDITSKYNWYFTVLTVKNSFDIQTVLNHLKRSFQQIRETIKLYKRGRIIDTVFTVIGGVYSIEITYNKKTGYHPHINLLMCTDKKINDCKMYSKTIQKKSGVTSCYWNSEKLSNEWKIITGDSWITSCTPLNIKLNLKENLMEIIKYSLKFNDMPTDRLIEIYPYLYRQRFFGSLGFMYGLGLDKIKIEDFEGSERQYIEFVMSYNKGIYTFIEKSDDRDIEIFNNNGDLLDIENVDIPIISSTKKLTDLEKNIKIDSDLLTLSKIL